MQLFFVYHSVVYHAIAQGASSVLCTSKFSHKYRIPDYFVPSEYKSNVVLKMNTAVDVCLPQCLCCEMTGSIKQRKKISAASLKFSFLL